MDVGKLMLGNTIVMCVHTYLSDRLGGELLQSLCQLGFIDLVIVCSSVNHSKLVAPYNPQALPHLPWGASFYGDHFKRMDPTTRPLCMGFEALRLTQVSLQPSCEDSGL